MSEPMRDRLRDELAGWPIGSGYYSTTVSVEDARDMADALLAAFPWLADEPSGGEVEAGARALFEHDCPTASREPAAAWVRARYEMDARVVLSAAREARMT